jgi:signal transduction histidine kinase
MKLRKPRMPPFWVDVLVALAVFAFAVIVPASAPSGLVRQNALTYLVIALGSAVLVLRRRRPMLVWAATLVLAVFGTVNAGPASPTVFPLLAAIYAVAVHGCRLRGVVAGLTSGVCLLVALAALGEGAERQQVAYLVLTWSGLATAIGVAMNSHRAVVAAAVERAQRAEESREQEAERRVTQERLRIAQDLHDVVAHHIAVITLQSGVALHLLDSRPAKAREAMQNVRDAGQEVLTEMKALLGLVRTPEDPARTQPAPGLHRVADLVEFWRGTDLEVTWRTSGVETSLSPLVDLTAYRLVQESLTNAAKHGNGSVDVLIGYSEDWTRITVSNGTRVAFVDGVIGRPETGSGRGLIGMRERVATVGGRVSTGFDHRNRFVVRAELPSAGPGHDGEDRGSALS